MIDLSTHEITNHCVYTTLTSEYQSLREQPVAKESGIPFICFTDNPHLRSETWKIQFISRLFEMDPIRSQQDVKLRPHVYLPNAEASLYIDSTLQLAQIPEQLFGLQTQSGISLLQNHSFENLVDEFLDVAENDFGDQSRIFEQLNHYLVACPDILTEKPYCTSILLRNHRNGKAIHAMDIWAAHVQRYSRHDQLSLNLALSKAELEPDVFAVDCLESCFYNWPTANESAGTKRLRSPLKYAAPPAGQVRLLQKELEQTSAQLQETLSERDYARESLQNELNTHQAEWVKEHSVQLQEERCRFEEILAATQSAHIAQLDQRSGEHAAAIAEISTQHALKLGEALQDAGTPCSMSTIEGLNPQEAAFAHKIEQTESLRKHALDLERLVRESQHECQEIKRSKTYRFARTLSNLKSRIYPTRNVNSPKSDQVSPAVAEISPPSIEVALNTSTVVTQNGKLIYVDPTDARGVRLMATGGDFNPTTLKIWKKLANAANWSHVIDVGANYGEMLVNMDFAPTVIITAVEPNPRILPYLQRTLSEAGIKCHIVSAALSNAVGCADLLIDREWSGTTRLASEGEQADDKKYELLQVSTTTLTAILRELPPVDQIKLLLKIDVEGKEVDVLTGLLGILDSLASFAAVVEVLHLSQLDIQWIFDHFCVYAFNIETNELEDMTSCGAPGLKELLAQGVYYPQDVCLTRLNKSIK